MLYEKVFHRAGSMGRAQYLIIFTTYLAMSCAGWQQLIYVFAARDVDFYCVDYSTSPESPQLDSNFFLNRCVEGCLWYVYDENVSSMVKEFELDCGPNRYLNYFIHPIYWLGYLISTLISGYLADKIGRKPTCVISLVLLIFASVVTNIFYKDLLILLAMRFLTGIANGGYYTPSYLIMVECCGKEHVSRLSLISQIICGVGGILGAAFGYFFRTDWRYQILSAALLASFTFFMSAFFFPESPRWLYAQNRTNEAEQVLKWIAKLNGIKEVEMITFKQLPLLIDESDVAISSSINFLSQNPSDPVRLFDLCKTFKGATLLMCHLFVWWAAAIIDFGLHFDAEDIGLDMYLSSIFLTACEVPSLLLIYIVDKVGRKSIIMFGVVIGSIPCFIIPFIQNVLDGYLEVSLAVLAKFMVTAACNCLYIYSHESFPTVLRSSAFGCCLAAQYVAAIMAAIIAESTFGADNSGSFIIYGVIGFLASFVLAVFGKETRGVPLLNTVEEYNKFAKS